MPSPSQELNKRSEALAARWRSLVAAPATDPLLEFAVAISSFTDYLHGKGLAGLHQMARGVEQQTLPLLDAAGPPPAPALSALGLRVQELTQRVADYLELRGQPPPERRAAQQTPADAAPGHRLWLLGDSGPAWPALVQQLGYFNLAAEFHPLDRLPQTAAEPTLVLLHAGGRTTPQTVGQLQALRARFSAAILLVHGQADDCDSLRALLGAGADHCFPAGTTPPQMLAKILDLGTRQAEEPYRALVVEDSPTASAAIQRTLAMIDVQTEVVARPQQVLERLDRFQPDLVLMDMFMPGCTGIEAARVIRQRPEFLSIPIVYLSGDTNIPMQVEALRLGGDHFLTKPYNPVVLNAVVQSKIERYRTLRRAMQRDSLTGLYNHGTSKDKLAAALQQARAAGQALAVAMLDIDHFKQINDRYGHPMGDQVIRNLAWFLRQRLRRSDLIGRYGGEEFLVVLPGADAAQAAALLDRIRTDFGRLRHACDGAWCTATLSGGVAPWQEGVDAATLIKQADEALYAAKHAGRDRILKRA